MIAGLGRTFPGWAERAAAWLDGVTLRLEGFLGLAFATGAADPEPVPEGDASLLEPGAGQRAVHAALSALGEDLAATRLVIWGLDTAANVIRPEASTGVAPQELAAGGSPLVWVLTENRTLRFDPAPSWASGDTLVAPVDATRVLSAELPPGRGIETFRLLTGARMLAPLLALADREGDALAATRRVDRVIELLRSVGTTPDPSSLPASLARAAAELLDGSGAVVASWDGSRGEILARAGDDGPREGQTFGSSDGDMGDAARLGTLLRRGPGDRARRPLAMDSERWSRPPAYRLSLPLTTPHGEAAGVVGVWSHGPLARQGGELLEALGPMVALQLRQAADLVSLHGRATIDPLTGLPNRSALDERLREELARFHRYRRPLSVIVVDLDRFKAINDTHGHAAGDAVLRAVADVVRTSIRDVDFAGRFGGEELVVVLPETMLRQALEVAERVRMAVEDARIEHGGVRIPVTASLGVSACPECTDDPDGLFGSADQALYASKEGGRNRVTTAAPRAV